MKNKVVVGLIILGIIILIVNVILFLNLNKKDINISKSAENKKTLNEENVLIMQDIGEYKYLDYTKVENQYKNYYLARYKNKETFSSVFVRVFDSLNNLSNSKEKWIKSNLYEYPNVYVQDGITLHRGKEYISQDREDIFWEYGDFIIDLSGMKSDKSLFEAYFSKYS